MSRRAVAALLVLALAVVAGVAWWQWRPAPREAPFASFAAMPPRVTTAEVRTLPFETTTRAVGTVEAAEQVTVTSRATGIVARILFEEGQRVVQGAPLVELDAGQEQAALEAARVEENEAARQARRLRTLRRQQLVAQSELDEANARWEAAAAQRAQAEAALAERRIVAPFSGVLGLRRVSPGALVEPGTAVTTLATLERLRVAFRVSSELLPQLRRGLAVQVHATGFDAPFTGTVTEIDNQVDPSDRSIAVEAELSGAPALRPGLFVSVDVVLSSRRSPSVPESAVLYQGRAAFVYVLEGDTARRRDVRLGERRPGLVEVREGLAPGERVIASGLQKVEEGRPVQAAPGAS
ncbi:MAG: efflux RND transporter periplasmic adaptor subunit [Thiohalomonadaceae bacterium]